MKMQKAITFSGVGGQGLMSAGNLLCLAAVIHAEMYATMASEYGTETRGTFAKSDVIVSEEPILYPEIEKNETVLCLSPIAYDRFKNLDNPDMVIVYDSDCVIPEENRPFRQIAVPFTSISREHGKLPVNMISLGYLTAMTECVPQQCMEDAIRETYQKKEKSLQRNLEGFRLGYQLMKEKTGA